MSDFEITMRDWRRLCDSMHKKYDDHGCVKCPLYGFACGGIYQMPENTDWRLLEERVDAWAAENPEPQYPTWAEWLEEMGLTWRRDTAARDTNAVEPDSIEGIPFIMMLSLKARSPIPADIAEKLGVKPKGGNGKKLIIGGTTK